MTTLGSDYSNSQLLLDTLNSDFPKEVSGLINNNESFKELSLKYLNDLFDSDSKILSNDKNSEDQISFLVNEIAELDSAQSSIEDKLKKTVVNSSNDIVESRFQLNNILVDFESDFNLQLTDVNNSLELALDIQASDENLLNHKINFETLKSIRKNLETKSSLSTILSKIDLIMDILELPSLAGACVKAGYYHETLEISSYTRRLSIRYPDVNVIRKIENGVKAEIEVMLVGLLKLLKTDLKQSNIVKIISYLKRIYPFNSTNQKVIGGTIIGDGSENLSSPLDGALMEINSGSMLRRIYFQSRYQFIINELDVLQPLKNHSVEKYLKRVVELIREHCYTSILTYQSLFSEDDEYYPSTGKGATDTSNEESEDEKDTFNDNDELIHDFIKHIIQKLIELLQANLPLVKERQAKDSLILQIIYCSQSLGRVGGDFSSLILMFLRKNMVASSNGDCSGTISEADWFRILKKQRALIKNLNNV